MKNEHHVSFNSLPVLAPTYHVRLGAKNRGRAPILSLEADAAFHDFMPALKQMVPDARAALLSKKAYVRGITVMEHDVLCFGDSVCVAVVFAEVLPRYCAFDIVARYVVSYLFC